MLKKAPKKGLRSDFWGSKQRVTDPAVDLSRDCFVAALLAMTGAEAFIIQDTKETTNG